MLLESALDLCKALSRVGRVSAELASAEDRETRRRSHDIVIPRPGSEGNHIPSIPLHLAAPHQQLEDSIIVPPAEVIETTQVHPIHVVHHKKYVHGEYTDYTPVGNNLNTITEEPLSVEVISESLYKETIDAKIAEVDANATQIIDNTHNDKKHDDDDQSKQVALIEGVDALQLSTSSAAEKADVIQRISSMGIFTPADTIDLTVGNMLSFGKLSIVNSSFGNTTTSTFVFDETIIHERDTLVS